MVSASTRCLLVTLSLMCHRLILLNGMKASDELNEEQLRQLMFDIEHAYAEFFRSLGGSRDGLDS